MNPYRVLDIDVNATPQDIVRAAGQALRRRQSSAREVAVAQKILLDPVSRKVHEFVHFIDLGPVLAGVKVKRPKRRDSPRLEYLDTFDKDQ
jgi:hypothetical protein